MKRARLAGMISEKGVEGVCGDSVRVKQEGSKVAKEGAVDASSEHQVYASAQDADMAVVIAIFPMATADTVPIRALCLARRSITKHQYATGQREKLVTSEGERYPC